ncbi:MAG: radical SAM protein [Candidatus Lokiarchaeota archaeon]|nr:radical SAM protein [Candidatus Lokiarchaeota archaeon]
MSVEISEFLGICGDCIREDPSSSLPYIKMAHKKARIPYGLPAEPPKTSGGIQCNFCSNQCSLGEGEIGYCGIRKNENGRFTRVGTEEYALFHAYLDPHVTNCCAAWFCPAGTGQGYPKYAYREGPEHGYSNLAVFFYGCNFSCLFCQNASHKEFPNRLMNVDDFIKPIKQEISCICFFGGSPEPQLPFALKASKRALELKKNKLRICWEWNGCGNPSFVRKAAQLSLETGGNIKFDLKAATHSLSLALSGVDNTQAFENFKMIATEFYDKRPDMPVLMASTLLVPGYVTAVEVEKIANFIAEINPDIPYSLLAFYPAFKMMDLSPTSQAHASRCYQVAKKYLNRVNVGNLHILGIRAQNELL